MNKIFLLILSAMIFFIPTKTNAATGTILFIPHDDRPISYHQTVQVVEAAGYKMIVPPKELLSNANNMGHPDELWDWLFKNISSADCAVISSDSLLYGGLIPSRKHEVTEEKISARLENFKKLYNKNFDLKIYVFDSLMRTPEVGTEGDIEEPEYYSKYGRDIFQYTGLLDKQEISDLTADEKSFLENLEKNIPSEILDDWMNRRKKNLAATKTLMDFTCNGVIDYLILGRDDNSPLSQTHRENREIISYAEKNNLQKNKFQSLAGIDEFNILLLNRAINEMTENFPRINIFYNRGVGGDTVPAFSDEKISASIDSAIEIAGGFKVSDPKRADFILMVNTDKKGRTIWGHNEFPNGKNSVPTSKPSRDTKYFAKNVEEFVKKNYPVGIADINFANGSDNALMKILKEKNLLFKLQSYSGWNTATNSTGFAIGTGILAKKMTDESKEKVLATRYLDDWAYQANVRTIVGNEIIKNFGDAKLYYQLGDKLSWAEKRNSELMKDFAEKNLPDYKFLKNFSVKNSWLRMFECDIIFS